LNPIPAHHQYRYRQRKDHSEWTEIRRGRSEGDLERDEDADDEIQAHTGGAGYEMQVRAGIPAKGSFIIDSPGSFEVESHHLEKIIAIFNAR
jgi:hypothetical protein